MKINVRHLSEDRFAEVKVEIENASFDLGLHGKDELKVLCATFKDACQEMESIIENMEFWEQIRSDPQEQGVEGENT